MKIAARNSFLAVAAAAALLTVVATVFSGGCRIRSNEERDGKANRAPVVAPTTEKAQKMEDRGDFFYDAEVTGGERPSDISALIREDKFFEKLADSLNRNYSLPENIDFRLKECGTANAEYDPADRSITVCFELFEHYRKLFEDAKHSKSTVTSKMLGAVRFAVLHEVGHALIDAYDLPVAGGEEDASDRFAVYVALTQLRADGIESVTAAAEGFRIESLRETRRDLDTTEHLANRQRAITSYCLLYGSAPTRFAGLVDDGRLSRERSESCESEFVRTSESWEKLLRQWRKD